MASNTHDEDGSSGEVTIPENAKYFIVSSYDYGDIYTEAEVYYKKRIDIEKLENKSFVKTILCIGDSLTEGDYGSEPSGTMNVQSENYPFFMQKYLDCEVSNQGKCGYTPIAYWNNQIKKINFKSINPQIVVIMLGTNGAMTDTLESDVDVYDDYNEYADTGTGDYCKIIEYVNEQLNGKVQIVLCTCPFVDSSRRPGNAYNVDNANVVIPKIADKYNLPLIDVQKELGLSKLNTKMFQPIDGLHFGRFGYSRLGTFIGSKIKSLFSFEFDS